MKKTSHILFFVFLLFFAGCSASSQISKPDLSERDQISFRAETADQALSLSPPPIDYGPCCISDENEISLPPITWINHNPDGTMGIWGFHFKIKSDLQDETNISSLSDLTDTLKTLAPIFMVEYKF
jgi:hypothetical protein